MEWTKQRITIVISTFIGVAGLVLFFSLYLPLGRGLKIRGSECRILETEIGQAQEGLSLFRKNGRGKSLITEEEVSRAIDELTRQGKSLGINFISLTPRQAEKSEGSRFRIFPIEMETESTYEALGRFLGSLDELQKSLVTVGGFDVIPNEGNPSKLKAKLTVQMYLAGA